VDRVSASEAEGRGFDPRQPRHQSTKRMRNCDGNHNFAVWQSYASKCEWQNYASSSLDLIAKQLLIWLFEQALTFSKYVPRRWLPG